MNVFLFNAVDYISESPLSIALGPSYLKSYFEKYSEFKDEIKIEILYSNILERIKKNQPDIVGMSVATEFYPQAVQLAQKIKASQTKTIVVVGGYHITNMPDILDKSFDVGIIGEGEITFKELVESIFLYRNSKEKWYKIKGIIFSDEKSNLISTGRRDPISVLDNIPFPYRDPERIKLFTFMITSRGCPFACSFCASSVFYGKTIRFYSSDYVILEAIELIKRYRVKHITIWDDLFIGNVTRLKQIVNLIKQEHKTFRSITFGVSARASIIAQHPEILELFKEMNILRVSLGFESGSERILKKLKGNSACVESNRKALTLLNKHRFLVQGGFIIGSPEETLEDLKDTYNFIINSKLDGGYAGLAVPYPNTEFWSYAEKKGLVSRDMDFSKLKLIPDFQSLKGGDFMLLSDKLNKKDVMDYGIKIQKHFRKSEIRSYFSPRTVNLRTLRLFMRNPLVFLPFIIRNMLPFLRKIKS
ncbi:MAG: B12-binding domain-containing radical SAM protein [Candidatus Kuenenia sp.]|nr:B12-binding domain-containing radical SAM protein [Candidatus Kuenenia hertensis]